MHRETRSHSIRIFILIDKKRSLHRTGASPVNEAFYPNCCACFGDVPSIGNVCRKRRSSFVEQGIRIFQEEH